MNNYREYVVVVVLISLIASVNYVNGVESDKDEEVAFQNNYATLWGGDHIKLLDHNREIQLNLDNHSGHTLILSIYLPICY